jgi:uncharacterized protein (DUF1800 family)
MDALHHKLLGGIAAASLLLMQTGYASTLLVDSRADIAFVEAQVRASQFLTRATFGPTEQEVDELAAEILQVGAPAAFEAWIDEQFDIPPSQHRESAKSMIQNDGFELTDLNVNPGAYREFAWWHIALTGEDQLRQRIAWALYQIAPVNTDVEGANQRRADASGEPAYLGLASYYDMLAANAFSNYRDVLRGITLSPVMGSFLSHALNPKGIPEIGQFPDENFAREVMQLFSIGVYELKSDGELLTRGKDKDTPIETYDNHTIEAMARVFTGLYFAGTRGYGSLGRNYRDPLEMDDTWHDSDSKVILADVVLPAGQSGMRDIEDTLDVIVGHPNVGPYIGKLLIQRLVKSNPSPRYVQAVSDAFENNGSGVRGDMRKVIKTILLHPEALESLDIKKRRKNPPALIVEATESDGSRLREPILRYAAFLRAMNVSSTHPSGRVMMNGVMYASLQSPYRAPSVFGFYEPNYIPATALKLFSEQKRPPRRELSAPEFEAMTSTSIPALANLFYNDLTNGGHEEVYRDGATGQLMTFRIEVDFTERQTTASLTELMDQLDILYCRGAMRDSTKSIITTEITSAIWNKTDRARAALLMTVTSPDCAVVN